MLPQSLYKPNSTRFLLPIVSEALPAFSSLFTLFVICIVETSTGDTLTAVLTVTGPRTPTDREFPLNANTCPKLLTSIHDSHAIFAYSSPDLSFLCLANSLFASALADKLLHPSSDLS